MPKFFLHLTNGNGFSPDGEGVDLPDQPAARQLAIESIRSIVAEEMRQGLIDLTGFIDVEDAVGNGLLHLTFLDAFDLKVALE